MKIAKFTLLAGFVLGSFIIQAQTADEIIDGYFENTGGKDAWGDLKGIKMTGKLSQQGMEIPLEIVQMADGRTYSSFSLQGMTIKQNVFDGETLWSTNFQSMKAEKSDDETTANAKLDQNDFPDSFFNYKDKGYTVELMGTETVDGTETFKIKLVKEPIMVDGVETQNVSYYFFDSEAYIPIAIENEVKNGPMAGQVALTTMSEYQEVDGLYFPFSISQGLKSQPGGTPITIESIELNPEVSDADFAFPEQ